MKVVVHCKTEQEWDIATEKLGYKWSDATNWDFYKEDSCINLNEVYYGNTKFYINDNYTILSFDEWLTSLKEHVIIEETDDDLYYLIELFKKLNIR